jgi:hypothetical protein
MDRDTHGCAVARSLNCHARMHAMRHTPACVGPAEPGQEPAPPAAKLAGKYMGPVMSAGVAADRAGVWPGCRYRQAR